MIETDHATDIKRSGFIPPRTTTKAKPKRKTRTKPKPTGMGEVSSKEVSEYLNRRINNFEKAQERGREAMRERAAARKVRPKPSTAATFELTDLQMVWHRYLVDRPGADRVVLRLFLDQVIGDMGIAREDAEVSVKPKFFPAAQKALIAFDVLEDALWELSETVEPHHKPHFELSNPKMFTRIIRDFRKRLGFTSAAGKSGELFAENPAPVP